MYTFSYYLPREVATIAPRPWWKPWAKSQIVYKMHYERQYHELTEAEAKLLMRSNSPSLALLQKVMPGATIWQLEQGKPTTPYVKVTS
jgi:hypothetical protein